MEEIKLSNRLSNHYSNEDLAISMGEIARENFAIKHPKTNKPNRISRRHLVSLLNEKHKNLNLADTLEVNELVKFSFEISSSITQEAIVETIKKNLGNDSVYNPKRVYPSNHVFQFSEKEKEGLTNKLLLLKSNAAEINSEDSKAKIETTLVTTQGLKFKKEFLGIGNTKSAKEYALNILSGYELMIEEHDKIKNINLNLVNDFHILRNELKSEREDVIQLLLDLYGDRAKQQYPELFDFKQIEQLDFEESWDKLNLSYNRINDQHNEFVNTVDAALDNFGNTISNESNEAWKNISSISKKRDLNQADLIGAGVQVAFAAGASAITGVIKTRNKSKETVAMIEREVEELKKKMGDDKELIIGDIFRLGKIYSKLSHSFLPGYDNYVQSNSSVIVSELKPLYDKILHNPIIRNAKEKNNKLIKSRRFLNQKNIDFNSNLEFSKEEEKRLGEILDIRKNEYHIALSLKPQKPFILINLFTFGNSSRLFDATFQDWVAYCKPVVDDYQYLQGLRKNEFTIRKSITNNILEIENELKTITQEIGLNSHIIMTEFNRSPDSEKEMIKLITIVKKIINPSREVLEVELDQDLQKKVCVEVKNSEIEEFRQDIKAIQEDIKIREKLSRSVIAAYRDFETENENGILHKISSKLENSLNVYLAENPQAEAKIIAKIESHLSNLPMPKGVDPAKSNAFKNDLAILGLDTLRIEFKVFNINQETKSLSVINHLTEKKLADNILNYAEDLKRNIELNKANYQDVKKALSDNSLEGLDKAAKLINPNAKNYNENLEQEIQDFLNGGDLIL